jgi:hypothetical protein
MRSRIHPGDGDPRHGTVNGYTNLTCRCPDCRDAQRRYQNDWAHRTGRNIPWAIYAADRWGERA